MRKTITLIILIICTWNVSAKKLIFSNDSIQKIACKVANWQITNFDYSTKENLHDYGIDAWTNATLYLGLLEWAKTDNNNPIYFRWLNDIGNTTQWVLPSNFKNHPKYQLYHADEFCIGQLYLNMYEIFKDTTMFSSVKERVDWILNHPPNPDMSYKNKQSWTWCDALFMAPQIYASLAEITKDERYLDFMNTEFHKTYNHLYDKRNKLFFRDDSYFDKREHNGKKIFWGRGNGWVIAGLVNLLKTLPEDSVHRPYYEAIYKSMIKKLVRLQSSTGFWHASLLDPKSFPAPEASATGLITYAVAYGLNNGLIKACKYEKSLEKGWKALNSIVNDDGKLGWVQPIGADPKKVTKDMTATYGVGAFLMAASEIYKIEKN